MSRAAERNHKKIPLFTSTQSLLGLVSLLLRSKIRRLRIFRISAFVASSVYLVTGLHFLPWRRGYPHPRRPVAYRQLSPNSSGFTPAGFGAIMSAWERSHERQSTARQSERQPSELEKPARKPIGWLAKRGMPVCWVIRDRHSRRQTSATR